MKTRRRKKLENDSIFCADVESACIECCCVK
jgi:hypothetical protein